MIERTCIRIVTLCGQPNLTNDNHFILLSLHCRHYDSVRIARDQRFFEKPVMETVSNLRVRFCLQTNELMCGPYAEALIVDVR